MRPCPPQAPAATRARSLASARGAASVEHAGLALLIALVCAAAIAATAASPPHEGARDLATSLARKLRCAPRLPDECWHDPLTTAYGRALAGAVRALAPAPRALAGPDGSLLLPVDFRTCRSASCATPGADPLLTASNRRVTTYVAASDGRGTGGVVEIEYWEYRPTLGWRRIPRRASAADVAALAATPLPETASPRLTPLETLAGRNHVRFEPDEEPPWRWRVESVVP